jgi:oligopeptidase B
MSNARSPKAKKVEFIRGIHGQKLIDNYNWLQDESRANPEVLQLIEEENKYTEEILRESLALKTEIFRELTEKYKTERINCSVEESTEKIASDKIKYEQVGNWLYWEKKENVEDQYEIRYRKKVGTDDPEVVLDLNKFSKDYQYFNFMMISYSPDRNFIAFVADLQGLENYITFIYDVNTKSLVEKLSYCVQILWFSDSKTLLYESSDADGTFRFRTIVRKHVIGTEQQDDEIIYYDIDNQNGFYVAISKSQDQKFILIEIGSNTSTEYRIMPYNGKQSEVKVFSPLVKNEQYIPYHSNGYFYIICNCDGAFNYKLMKTSIDKTEKQYWQEVIPHHNDVSFTSSDIGELQYSVMHFKDYIVCKINKNGKQKILYVNTTNDEVKEVDLKIGLPFSEITLFDNIFDSDILKFSVESYGSPRKIYEFNLRTIELKLISYNKVSNFDENDYISELIWAPGEKGLKIPISIIYRKDLFKKDGSNPCILEAYGAYGSTDYEYFEKRRICMADRGFVFGEAHVRGSGYLGKKWHLDGIGINRINRFKDYISCSEYLITQKYTTSDKLIAYGRSAGGQIMGAILNMRPDLYKCVLVPVPGMDVLNEFYDKISSFINVEISEEGGIENRENFNAMFERDMYYQIKPTNFPHIFTTAGLYDNRAFFWRPLKWFCKLRESNTGNNIQIIKIEDTGHWSTTDKYSDENYFAELYAFAIWCLGK